MEFAYVIYAPSFGYFVDTLMAEPWVQWSEDLLDARLFVSFELAVTVQKYLCWNLLKGEKVVGVAPFPVNIRVEV